MSSSTTDTEPAANRARSLAPAAHTAAPQTPGCARPDQRRLAHIHHRAPPAVLIGDLPTLTHPARPPPAAPTVAPAEPHFALALRRQRLPHRRRDQHLARPQRELSRHRDLRFPRRLRAAADAATATPRLHEQTPPPRGRDRHTQPLTDRRDPRQIRPTRRDRPRRSHPPAGNAPPSHHAQSATRTPPAQHPATLPAPPPAARAPATKSTT